MAITYLWQLLMAMVLHSQLEWSSTVFSHGWISLNQLWHVMSFCWVINYHFYSTFNKLFVCIWVYHMSQRQNHWQFPFMNTPQTDLFDASWLAMNRWSEPSMEPGGDHDPPWLRSTGWSSLSVHGYTGRWWRISAGEWFVTMGYGMVGIWLVYDGLVGVWATIAYYCFMMVNPAIIRGDAGWVNTKHLKVHPNSGSKPTLDAMEPGGHCCWGTKQLPWYTKVAKPCEDPKRIWWSLVNHVEKLWRMDGSVMVKQCFTSTWCALKKGQTQRQVSWSTAHCLLIVGDHFPLSSNIHNDSQWLRIMFISSTIRSTAVRQWHLRCWVLYPSLTWLDVISSHCQALSISSICLTITNHHQ